MIQSTDPEIVYVPEYGTAVYGGGWAYPEPYYGYMYPAGWGIVGFGAGLAVGGALWGNANWGWGRRHRHRHQPQQQLEQPGQQQLAEQQQPELEPSAEHRKGVNYRDKGTADRFGGQGGKQGPQ